MTAKEIQKELEELWKEFEAHPQYKQMKPGTEKAIVNLPALTSWTQHHPGEITRFFPWDECVIMWRDFQDAYVNIKTNYAMDDLRAMLR